MAEVTIFNPGAAANKLCDQVLVQQGRMFLKSVLGCQCGGFHSAEGLLSGFFRNLQHLDCGGSCRTFRVDQP